MISSASPHPNQPAADANPILEGRLPLVLWQMSWPLLLSSFLTAIIGISDLCIAGLISPSAQVSVGVGEQVIVLVVMLGAGLATGTSACVSRCIGAGAGYLAKSYILDSLVISAGLGLLATIAGMYLSAYIFQWLQTTAEIAAIGTRYLQLCCLANLPFLLVICLCAIYRAMGKPRYALYIWLPITGISIGGAWLAVAFTPAGQKPCLDLIPWSWTVGSGCGLVLGLICLRQAWKESALNNNGPREPQRERIKQLSKIGLPTVVADIASSISHIIMFRLLAGLPAAADLQAAWSIGIKLEETFAAMPLLSLSLAAGAIVGQNLGAGQIERARLTGWQLALVAGSGMLLMGFALSWSAGYLAQLFSNSTAVISMVTNFLSGNPLMLPLLAITLVLLGCMEGAGSTTAPMNISLLGSVVLRVPLAWLLINCWGWSLPGAWLSLFLSRLVVCIASLWSFTSSNWFLTNISKSLTVQLDRSTFESRRLS